MDGWGCIGMKNTWLSTHGWMDRLAEQIPERHWAEGVSQAISGGLLAKCQQMKGTALHPRSIHINLSASDTFTSNSPVPALG